MNRQEIEKRFDEKERFWFLFSEYDWEDIKSFFFDEILPEVLRDILDNKVWIPHTRDDILNSYIEGKRDFKEILEKTIKEKYNITL